MIGEVASEEVWEEVWERKERFAWSSMDPAMDMTSVNDGEEGGRGGQCSKRVVGWWGVLRDRDRDTE